MRNKSKNSKRGIGIVSLAIASAAVVGIAVAMLYPRSSATAGPHVVVYKSPACGCCSKWVQHLEKNGFTVESHNRRDMDRIRKVKGIPYNMASCHTAKVDGYLIEGHVPADLITRLLKEKPGVAGLAVPGMPMGSPGMEGPVRDRYKVMAFRNGEAMATVYAER